MPIEEPRDFWPHPATDNTVAKSRHETLESALAELWEEGYGEEVFHSEEWELLDPY